MNFKLDMGKRSSTIQLMLLKSGLRDQILEVNLCFFSQLTKGAIFHTSVSILDMFFVQSNKLTTMKIYCCIHVSYSIILYKIILKATSCLSSSLQNILNLKSLILNIIKKNKRLYICTKSFFMRRYNNLLTPYYLHLETKFSLVSTLVQT